MKQTLQILALAAYIAIVMVGGMGCRNTAEGVGEDMERAGEKIQDKVD